MPNECKTFFKIACKTAKISQKDAIKAVWGKCAWQEYWLGQESETIGGHCIWCARAEAVLQDKV